MKQGRFVMLVFLLSALSSCAGSPEVKKEGHEVQESVRHYDPALILGRTWRWIGTQTPVEYIAAADPERYTLLLEENGRARIRFDCNRGGGNYEISGHTLKLDRLFSTRMGCPPDSQDAVFARQLEAVRVFFVENGELYLDLFADGGTMRFATDAE